MGTSLGGDKDYGHDPNKREVRRKFLEFIEKSLGSNHGSTKVLCLPGADLWEFNEIYSHLPNLKQQNVYIIERNQLNARLMQAALPEAHVFGGELSDFLETTKEKFDIVSLDFCSEMKSELLDILYQLRFGELLSDRAVFLMAVSGRREKADGKGIMQAALDMAAFHGTPEDSLRASALGYYVPAEVVDTKLSVIRGDCFSNWLSSILMGNSNKCYVDWLNDHANPAFLARIEEMAFRKYSEMMILRNGEDILKDHGQAEVRAPSGVVKRFGVNLGVPGKLDNVLLEQLTKVIMTGKIIGEKDGSIQALFPPEKHNNEETRAVISGNTWRVEEGFILEWINKFWADVKNPDTGLLDPQTPEFLSWNLLKYALMTLIKRDLEKPYLVVKHGAQIGPAPKWVSGSIFEYLFGCKGKAYWIIEHERYRYVSDSKCPMLVDMMKVDRTYQYVDLVTVSPEGQVIPNVPEKLLASRNRKKIIGYVDDQISDMKRLHKDLMKVFGKGQQDENGTVLLEYFPPRQEVSVDDATVTCGNCKKIGQELEVLKDQLREMKEFALSKKKMNQQVMEIKEFDRLRIIEALKGKVPVERIVADLGVTKYQVSAVKAWLTMKGDEYIADLRNSLGLPPEQKDVQREKWCDNCGRLEQEELLLTAQLRELKNLIVSRKQVTQQVQKISPEVRARVIELLKHNLTAQEIADKVGLAKMQVAALKAWQTMRSEEAESA